LEAGGGLLLPVEPPKGSMMPGRSPLPPAPVLGGGRLGSGALEGGLPPAGSKGLTGSPWGGRPETGGVGGVEAGGRAEVPGPKGGGVEAEGGVDGGTRTGGGAGVFTAGGGAEELGGAEGGSRTGGGAGGGITGGAEVVGL
jgi:hypothetical protein